MIEAETNKREFLSLTLRYIKGRRKTMFVLTLLLFLCGLSGNAQGEIGSIDTTAVPLVRGCYLTVQEYVDNNPSIRDSLFIRQQVRTASEWKGTIATDPRYAPGYTKVRNIWGYSDGENTYIYMQRSFFKLLHDQLGTYFYGYRFIEGTPSRPAGNDGKGFNEERFSEGAYLRASKYKVRYAVDLQYGWIGNPNPSIRMPKRTEEVIFYRGSKNETEAPIELVINDTLNLTLEPNAYFHLDFIYRTAAVKVCLGNDSATCQSYLLTQVESDYFNITNAGRSSGEKVIHVSESKGEYYSLKAYQAQKKREKKGKH